MRPGLFQRPAGGDNVRVTMRGGGTGFFATRPCGVERAAGRRQPFSGGEDIPVVAGGKPFPWRIVAAHLALNCDNVTTSSSQQIMTQDD